MRRGAIGVVAAILLPSIVVAVGHQSAQAAALDAPCGRVTLVFARGSGQSLGEREAPKFFEKVTSRLDGISVNSYELSTESLGGGQYPAYGIGVDSAQAFKNLIEADASWTGFAGGQYRASVSQGVTELTSYLTQRGAACPNEIFAVGGYSQGAQVVGDALPGLSSALRSRIAFVPLFGDPKLYLPEGRGPLPPACRGREFSVWRRGNVSCFTDNGILEARVPYMPADIQDRVGSWCDRNDPICNNNLADFAVSAHKYYADDGAEMDQAAREVAQAIADRLPPDEAANVDVSFVLLAAGANGVDVAFIIDTTGSMSGQISAAVSVADSVGSGIVALRGRVALTEYKDAGDVFVAEVRTPLTTDITAFRGALGTLFASGGGDTPEALLSALMTTFDGLEWTPGATKAAVILTDATYHDPDVANGWTAADVVARSLEIDPVNVYPVVSSGLVDIYTPLAQSTAGQVVVNSGDTAAALTAAFDEIGSRPVVEFPFDEYVAAPGEETSFEVFAYDLDSEIVSFDWDFDADGTVDVTTTEPRTLHTYDADFSGRVEVRAHSADGGIGSATASVNVSTIGLGSSVPGAPTGAAATILDAATGAYSLSWDAPLAGLPVDGWTVSTPAGELIAKIAIGSNTVVVSGVPAGGATVELRAFNAFGSSDPVSISLPPATVSIDTRLLTLRDEIRASTIDRVLKQRLVTELNLAIYWYSRGKQRLFCAQLFWLKVDLESPLARRKIPAQIRTAWLDEVKTIKLMVCGR